ncbi:hypothetical protein [Capnocytophaga sp. oral taxon 380]|jgi:lipoprotein|uniref:hypothetical protein n=1 Tax=Capnocytophaga sp. oral taxon 380 TaxID=712217 RepID=UPI0002A42866|nr:hypothetical protein [Capnocytophaga sp. oral taxon 380]EKY07406.1 hypothetical protein HMPREF9078_01211 [Capnocytophaga sp. oral taxon 380 str. F0488]
MKKNVFKIVIASLIIIGGLVFYSCQKDDNQEQKQDNSSTVFLNFESQNNKIQKVKVNIKYINHTPKIVSDKLIEIKAKDKNAKEEVSVFVLKDSNEKKNNSLKRLSLAMAVNASSESGECNPEVRKGYQFDGVCFVYGTMIVTNDCERRFFPSSGLSPGFEDICPERGGAFAKDYSGKNNENIKLK